MKNSFGNNITITLFGESHGSSIGAVIDGLAPGIPVIEKNISDLLTLRRPVGAISTPRSEKDSFKIESGVYNGFTTGTPLSIIIKNENTRSEDYNEISRLLRPGHADFSGNCKYHGYEDYRGGGHFSGRLTAPIVAAAGIIIPALEKKGIHIGTHISRLGKIDDSNFSDMPTEIEKVNKMMFPVIDDSVAEEMQKCILNAKAESDSIGGVLETAITGVPAGLGEPWFDTIEGLIAHAVFSIPAIKGIEFGDGFNLADMNGSTANDPFKIDDNGHIETETNHNGGINGGISNGMPITFKCAVKPTPTISKKQNTVDIKNRKNSVIEAKGRHDPCIVHRAAVVVRAVTAITICDILCGRYGTDWMCK